VSNAPSKPVYFSRPKVGYFSNRPRTQITWTDVTEHKEQTASMPIITWQWVHKTSGERLSTVKLVLENKNVKILIYSTILVPVWNKRGETSRNLSHDRSSLGCALNLGPLTHEGELMMGDIFDCNVCV